MNRHVHVVGVGMIPFTKPGTSEPYPVMGARAAKAALADAGIDYRLVQQAHVGYVYGVALHDTGKPADGVRQLERVLQQHPDDPPVLQALTSYSREAGDMQRAMAASARLQELNAAGP